MTLEMEKPGLLTTVQDLGRTGYQKYGIMVSGAMDAISLRMANLLVGNPEGEAALEMTLIGPELRIHKDCVIAITGGDLSPTLNGHLLPMWRPVRVQQDSLLRFGECRSGCRAYLAIGGGLSLSPVMGSLSTTLRAGIGGYDGRALQRGDQLQLQDPSPRAKAIFELLDREQGDYLEEAGVSYAATWLARSWHIPLEDGQPIGLRAVPGAHYRCFDSASQSHLFGEVFRVTPQSDRMGYRLSSSESLELTAPLELISEATAPGTVQVPPDGNPIVLMADRQTIGGYPKAAQIITPDLAVLAQVRPGREVYLQAISQSEAEELYVHMEEELRRLQVAITWKLQG